MSSGENVLWIVTIWSKRGASRRVFRTRAAARAYYEKVRSTADAPVRATWGPEQ